MKSLLISAEFLKATSAITEDIPDAAGTPVQGLETVPPPPPWKIVNTEGLREILQYGS
jgi:hypothetical protein